MRPPVSTDNIREILLRHDPLVAWPPVPSNPDRYAAAAELAAGDLAHMHGVGHALTVVADALDRLHPGLYRALRAGDPELGRRLGLVARELWDRHGNIVPGRPGHGRSSAAQPPAPSPAAGLLDTPGMLEGWLRTMEAGLEDESSTPVAERKWADLMAAVLPGIVDAYGDAEAQEREEARSAFSRFRLCCYQLSRFVGLQHAELNGTDPSRSLRRALVGESLLDMNLDWRDELLLIQALKSRAESRKLPYAELVQLAADLSSERTADFLRNA